jgi:hypothetical protein
VSRFCDKVAVITGAVGDTGAVRLASEVKAAAVEVEKIFTFRMRGIGYWHPHWVTEPSMHARDRARIGPP